MQNTVITLYTYGLMLIPYFDNVRTFFEVGDLLF